MFYSFCKVNGQSDIDMTVYSAVLYHRFMSIELARVGIVAFSGMSLLGQLRLIMDSFNTVNDRVCRRRGG